MLIDGTKCNYIANDRINGSKRSKNGRCEEGG